MRVLFDAPTSALDPELVGEVPDVIKEHARSGTTMIIVTHEIGFAREVDGAVVFMDAGEILEIGPPALIFNDALKEFSMFLTRRSAVTGPALFATMSARAFDRGLEQPGRLHTSRNDAAIALIPRGFPFVTPGSLTVGIHPNNPPISTYATDARTSVGFDPDLITLTARPGSPAPSAAVGRARPKSR